MGNYYHDSFQDYNGDRIIVDWTEKLWQGHCQKHQLVDIANTSRLIKSAVEDPCVVMEGIRPGGTEKTAIYYKEVKRHKHYITYIKVVCLKINIMYVKTVFVQTAPAGEVVRERCYNTFKETWKKHLTNIY